MPDHNDIFDAFRLCYGITTKVDKDKNEKLKDADGIYITRDGDTVKAVAVQGIDKLASATAKCSPDDVFDFNIGAKLAMDRLYKGYDMTPKQKRKPYNGKIFIECCPSPCLEDHHVYQVHNGVLPVVTKNTNPYIFCDMDDADLSFTIHKACWDHSAIKGSIVALRTRAYFVKG